MTQKVEISEKSAELKDRFYATFILFYSLGLLISMNTHFFYTVTNYWMHKFRDPVLETWDAKEKNQMQSQFTSACSIVAGVGTLVFVLGVVFLHKKLAGLETPRLLVSLGGMMVSFFLTLVFVRMDTDEWQAEFLVVTLITLVLLTGSCSVLMVTAFEVVAKFPPIYAAFIPMGQAMCGLVSALMQVFSLSLGNEPHTTGLIYFSMGFALVALTTALFVVNLRKSRFYQHHNAKVLVMSLGDKDFSMSKRAIVSVVDKVKLDLVSLLIVIGGTVIVHPGVTALVVSVDYDEGTEWSRTYYTPIATFFTFGLFEFLGRLVVTHRNKVINGAILITGGAARMVLIPALLLSNVHPRHHLPVVFGEDFMFVIFMSLFGFSYGFLSNASLINITTTTDDAERKPAMFILMSILLLSGAGFSALSPFLVKAI